MTATTAAQRASMAAYYRKNRERILADRIVKRLATDPQKLKAMRAESYANNPEKYKAQASRWAERNPERKKANDARYHKTERCKATHDEWVKNNLERYNAARASWNAANAEKMKAYRAQWNKDNPEAKRVYKATRRARKVSAGGCYTSDDVKTLFVLQRGMCVVCRGDLGKKYHVDHIVPLVAGGCNDKHNIQLLCPDCNCRKRDKNPIVFMQSKGYLL